jgi:hypothetical protein
MKLLGIEKMKITKQRLKEIIKEEIDTAVEEGLFDRIKSLGSRAGSKVTQTYPATELTTLLSMIQKASRQSGVKFKGKGVKRGDLVDEFEKILSSGGFRIDEQRNRLFIGKDGNIPINSADAPVLTKFLTTLKAQSPDVFKKLAKQMNSYRFDLPAELAPAGAAGEDDAGIPTDAKPATPPAPSPSPPGAPAVAAPAPSAAPSPPPPSGLKNLKPGEVMVALNQLGLRQGTIERAAKKALANRGLTKTDRENIEAVAKQLISYLEGGLKESKIIVGPAAMRMIEELYENRWKEIVGIK